MINIYIFCLLYDLFRYFSSKKRETNFFFILLDASYVYSFFLHQLRRKRWLLNCLMDSFFAFFPLYKFFFSLSLIPEGILALSSFLLLFVNLFYIQFVESFVFNKVKYLIHNWVWVWIFSATNGKEFCRISKKIYIKTKIFFGWKIIYNLTSTVNIYWLFEFLICKIILAAGSDLNLFDLFVSVDVSRNFPWLKEIFLGNYFVLPP